MEEKIVWRRRLSVGWLMISLMVVAWGIIWLGNDLKWWDINFPLIPVIVVIIGLSMLVNQILAIFY
ncbi:MAG: hypothetical protein WC821_03340 [archaeon]|jgi:hypothetical protein